MAYTPPPHDQVPLGLAYAYTPPDHRDVPLRFGAATDEPPPPARAGRTWAVSAAWTPATAARRDTGTPWRSPPLSERHTRAPWALAELRPVPVRTPWRDAHGRRPATALCWMPSTPCRADHDTPWAASRVLVPAATLVWTPPAARVRPDARTPWRSAQARRPVRVLVWEHRERLWRKALLAWRRPGAQRHPWRTPWEQARRIRWWVPFWRFGRRTLAWGPEAAPGPVYTPPADGGAVGLSLVCPLLDWPGSAVWLVFEDRACGDVPPRRRVYWVFNMIRVVRLPDRVAVPCEALSLAVDYDSWAWDVRLVLPGRDALTLVAPDAGGPKEVEITANGYTWTALVEGYEEGRRFGRSTYTVWGRSRSAYLAAPYAEARSYEETTDKTAQQLAVAELGSSGWTLVWSVPDWLVPAGAYSYRERTPIQAVSAIAAAVGARVQTHLSADELQVLSRYPVSPWDWAAATPDATLTASILTSLSLRWAPQPAWNGVYVSGETQGVLCHVKRTGTAGSPYHPMVVDPLITHVDAGRERGRVVLSGGGKQALVTVELPLFAAPQPPGLLTPGTLVEVQDGVETWRGLVTACRVAGSMTRLTQTVEIERHY